MRIDLTTNSPASHYGIPALRIEEEEGQDYGPADMVQVAGKPVYAGALVALWGNHIDRTKEERGPARLFCCQWPEGMQVEEA